jgi:hypothetical protein
MGTLATLCWTEKRIGAAKCSNFSLIRKLKGKTCVIRRVIPFSFQKFFSKTEGPACPAPKYD